MSPANCRIFSGLNALASIPSPVFRIYKTGIENGSALNPFTTRRRHKVGVTEN